MQDIKSGLDAGTCMTMYIHEGGSCLSANPTVPYLTCDRAHRVLEGTHPRTLYTHMYMSYFTHVLSTAIQWHCFFTSIHMCYYVCHVYINACIVHHNLHVYMYTYPFDRILCD